ncbi:MAG TPA: CopD family protein [Candidatus Manganitrophaceae bacterium]|nr:CopD family protein [Candidatus Manganitrophaceae bacterium]
METAIWRELDLHLLSMALFRWLDIAGVVLWVGAIGFRRLIFPAGLAVLSDPAKRQGLQREEAGYTEPVLFWALLYLFIVHFLTWVHQAGMMSGKPFSAIGPILPVVLTKTHFGAIWIVKLFLLALLLFLIRSGARHRDPLLLGSGFLLCLTGSLTGHAIRHGSFYPPLLSDWVHYVAVSIWAGGLPPLLRLARKSGRLLDPPASTRFLKELIERFSRWALLSVILILSTGVYNGFFHLQGRSITDTAYGQAFLLKLVIVLIAFGLGGASRFYILPSLRKMEEEKRGASNIQRCFIRLVGAEIVFMVAALLLAALLTQTPTPAEPPG